MAKRAKKVTPTDILKLMNGARDIEVTEETVTFTVDSIDVKNGTRIFTPVTRTFTL